MRRLLLGTILFTVAAPGLVTAGVPAAILLAGGGLRLLDAGPWRWAGAALAALGAAVYLRCAADFVRRGQGTPAPWDAPRRLVVAGLYRLSRNPMYLGVVAVVLGEALWFGSLGLLLWAALALAAFHLRVVVHEEPHLRKRFGADYEAYARRVRRWL